MKILIIILIIYILSVIGIRWLYRVLYKYDILSSKSCTFNISWIIPFCNTIVFIFLIIICSLGIIEYKANKSKLLSKLFNYDLEK